MARRSLLLALPALALACSSPAPSGPAADAGVISFGDAGPPADAGLAPLDGGYPLPDGGTVRADRFVTSVVSFTPGHCGGFGAPELPGIVMGPPDGAGDSQGSLDVVSLGVGGSIELSFAPNAIVDGPGVDFVVFENAFDIGGNPDDVYAEPGEVSVSDDGQTWHTFPCTATQAPYGACAGWHPVYSARNGTISPVDYPACGGDAFDLADVGVTRARYVRVRDMGYETCPTDPKLRSNNAGFDLDAVAIVNAETP